MYNGGLQPSARRFRGRQGYTIPDPLRGSCFLTYLSTIPDPLRGSCFSYLLAYNSWSSTRIVFFLPTCLQFMILYEDLLFIHPIVLQFLTLCEGYISFFLSKKKETHMDLFLNSTVCDGYFFSGAVARLSQTPSLLASTNAGPCPLLRPLPGAVPCP